jgi:hypothetical protein
MRVPQQRAPHLKLFACRPGWGVKPSKQHMQRSGVLMLCCPIPLQVILSDAVTKLSPPFFWLGAGEVHLKLGLQVSEFIAAINPFIADCT